VTPANLRGYLREYRLAYGTTNDAQLECRRIAHKLATALGHIPLRQGESVECSRCGASGYAREVVGGAVHTETCGVSP
jgi:hypothetical protein